MFANTHFAPVTPFKLDETDTIVLDLSASNTELSDAFNWDTATFDKWLKNTLVSHQKKAAIGGYLEKRGIYRRSEHFGSEVEARNIHLGIDIWAEAGTPIFAPYHGKIHSFQNNNNFGDYGPTIILEHTIEELTFYTLYGHLSLESLDGKTEGQTIEQGEQFADFGDFPINGDWSPHLHFQVILDLQGKKGDFFGVCEESQIEFYQKICPNSNFIIQSNLIK
ncbi:MAG: peptidoglycan DD-metalloendopeptidase family protein [Raineya sp.]|jgi:murein DD-endopeptidase MepM/ murein hydrolase activator NlpD|nr:peptidoglycan DD-metalloendopeptidase family protein [Raineya sp.]